MEHRSGCLVCGKDLRYLEAPTKLRCEYCHDLHEANAVCVGGHFICNLCRQLGADDAIEQYCTRTAGKDPIIMAITLMRNPQVKMHGPEHHVLVPSVLLAAYYNATNEPQRKTKWSSSHGSVPAW